MKSLFLGDFKGQTEAKIRTVICKRLKSDKKIFQGYTILIAYEEVVKDAISSFFLLKSKMSGFILHATYSNDGLFSKLVLPTYDYLNTLWFFHLNGQGQSIDELDEMRAFIRLHWMEIVSEPQPKIPVDYSKNVDLPEGEKFI
jgi:hypothetical protein